VREIRGQRTIDSREREQRDESLGGSDREEELWER
jgi:hypothetical protein